MNDPQPAAENRRGFLQTVAAGTVTAGLTASTATATLAATRPEPETPMRPDEFRNRQPGMSYRRLGRTGMMISEIVSGGDPITLANYRHLHLAIERGLNYLDMAPSYASGRTEEAYGKLLAERPGLRDQVFLTTKASGFIQQRWDRYRAIFDRLPEGRQAAIQDRARQLLEARGVRKPGYYLTYYPGQQNDFEPAYLALAMRDEFGPQVEGDPALRRYLLDSIEGSLKRVGTDHFDILMCPHGAAAPEELEAPEILDTFQELKRQGKVRFLGVTSHNDPAGVLRKAAALGHYDAAMVAYNVVNGGHVEEALRTAADAGIGVVAMKVAMAVATHHKPLQPVPDWRIQMVNRIVPGDWKAPQKAYLWALQNPRIAGVISNLWDETFVADNLALAGQKVELQPA